MTQMNSGGFNFRPRKTFSWRKEIRHNGFGWVTQYTLSRWVRGEKLAISIAFSKHEQRIGMALGLKRARWQMRQAIAERFA